MGEIRDGETVFWIKQLLQVTWYFQHFTPTMQRVHLLDLSILELIQSTYFFNSCSNGSASYSNSCKECKRKSSYFWKKNNQDIDELFAFYSWVWRNVWICKTYRQKYMKLLDAKFVTTQDTKKNRCIWSYISR